ncbi:MAG: ATP-binding protein [Gemmatimonadota bacterium]
MDVIRPHIPRAAHEALERALGSFPLVVVTGARQTGKTTLVRGVPALAGRPFLSLDDPEVRDQARRDPAALLERGPDLILDEVQHAPDLLLAVRSAVDAEQTKRPGRFVVTGSADLLLMERFSATLGSRAHYLELWPLTRRERHGLGRAGRWSELFGATLRDWPQLLDARADQIPAEDWHVLSAMGGLPVPAHALQTQEERARWFDDYVDAYLDRDLQALARIDDVAGFRRLLRSVARRAGTVVNQADVAREIAVPRPTVHRWLDLLETSFQIVRIPALAEGDGKRLVKSPKVYLADVALTRHLAGGEPAGAHLESLVLADLLAWRELVDPWPEILHWRTFNEEKVDFVVELGSALLAVDVRTTTRPSYQDARHLRTFRAAYGPAVKGALLLHCGKETFWVSEGVLAVPWWLVI